MSTLNPSMHEAPPDLDEMRRPRARRGRLTPTDEEVVPVYRTPVKLSWGAILGGLVVALGVWLLLETIGLAAGLASVDPANPISLKHAGIGTGIYSLIVPLVSLLVGGLVAARTAGIVDRTAGALHGAVLWALSLLATLVLVGFVVRGVVSAALGITGGVAGEVMQAGPGMGHALGIDENDLLGPVNQRLRAEGKPAVTANELRAATHDAMRTAMREGRFDREMLVTALAAHTRLTPEDARDVTANLETQVGAQGDQTAQNVETGALQAADTTGKALWWVVLAMALGLGASIVGATLGVSRRQRLAATTEVPLAV